MGRGCYQGELGGAYKYEQKISSECCRVHVPYLSHCAVHESDSLVMLARTCRPSVYGRDVTMALRLLELHTQALI